MMSFEERFELITRNLQEIISEEELEKLLKTKKEISLYWGTMPTGSISIAYFFPMLKIADFLKAGLKVKILFADLHAALDSVPWEELEKRQRYYEEAIKLILKTIGVSTKKLEFVEGSKLQLNKKYFNDLLKLTTLANFRECKKAACEVVKNVEGENAKLSAFIYPLMQALDEEYLDVDIQFGGLDQRKIMVFAREILPKIGYKSRIELMNPIIRGLVGEKMSSSKENTKIDLMDDEETVRRRINKADCVEGDINNGILALTKYLIFVIYGKLEITRDEKFGGDIIYSSYEKLEKDFSEKKLHPRDLKKSVADSLNKLLMNFRKDAKLKELHKIAYKE
jgi:tyrosyl-tRNA synthetase